MSRKSTSKERVLWIKIIFYLSMSFFPNRKIRRLSASKVIDLINILESEEDLWIKIRFYLAMSFFPNGKVRYFSSSRVIDLINTLESEEDNEV